MELKMKPWVVVWTIVLLCVMPQSGRAQNKQLEKELKKEYKTKLKEYKKDGRNVGEHLVIGPFSLIFIEIVLGILGVRLIYQCISSFVPVFFCLFYIWHLYCIPLDI